MVAAGSAPAGRQLKTLVEWALGRVTELASWRLVLWSNGQMEARGGMNAAGHRTRQSLVCFELRDSVIIGMSPACSLSLCGPARASRTTSSFDPRVLVAALCVSRRIFATNEACPDLQAARSRSGRPDCSVLVDSCFCCVLFGGSCRGQVVRQRARHTGCMGGLLYVGSRRPEHQVSVVLPLAPRVIGHCTKVSCDAVGVGLAEDGGPTVGLWVRGPAGEIWDAGAGASNTQSISSGQSLA
jgi:hypothetical protein